MLKLQIEIGRSKYLEPAKRAIVVDAVANVLEKNMHLEGLRFAWSSIGSPGAVVLAESLVKNSSVRELDLAMNNIDAKGASAIANALKKRNPAITSLNLEYNDIGEDGQLAIASVLETENGRTATGRGHLTNLAISHSGSRSATASGSAILNAIANNLNLTHLKLSDIRRFEP